MMKKWISALLALALTLGVLGFSAAESGGAIVLPETGVVMERTEALKNARGQIEVSELTGLAAFPEAMLAIVTYMAMTEQEYAPLREAVDRYTEAAQIEKETGKAVPDAVVNAAMAAQGPLEEKQDALCFVLALPEGQTWADVADTFTSLLGVEEEGFLAARDLGENAGFNHYMISFNPASAYVEETGKQLGGFADEYKALLEDMDALQANTRLVEPGRVVIGREIAFETTDLDGNPVSSKELFAQHAVTMLNIYTTWCGYCYMEMPALEKLSQEFADRDAAVVGLCLDAYDETRIAQAKQMLADTGVTYLNLAAGKELADAMNIHIFPTTLFVGRDGKTILLPMTGAQIDRYPVLLEQALNPGQAATAETAAPAGETAGEKGTYTVHFTDQDGRPVPEAIIGFCTEAGCVPVDADENGTAVYEAERTAYHLTIVELPDGYAEPEDFDMSVGPDDAEITVRVTKE